VRPSTLQVLVLTGVVIILVVIVVPHLGVLLP
jgi:hypothetical protein